MSFAYDGLFVPFADYAFMRRALVIIFLVAAGSAPLGVLLILRRMSLMAEAMAHAILPGIAVAFMAAGFSLPLMSLGGFCAGIAVALLAGLAVRLTRLREDASFAALYPIALALGVLLVSMHGSAVDLVHLLFGSILTVDGNSLFLTAGIVSATLIVLAVSYRPMLIAVSDPAFFRSQGGHVTGQHLLFLILVTLNLVAGFQAFGTLMTVGMMIIPAVSARFWTRRIDGMMALAFVGNLGSGVVGLLLSYHFNLPSGPAIILTAAIFYALSLGAGRYDSIRARYWPGRHLTR